MNAIVVIFLDSFHSTKRRLPLVDSWSCGLDYNQMYPDRDILSPDCDTLSNVPCSGYITACGQSMMESGGREGGKNTASFKLKSNDF